MTTVVDTTNHLRVDISRRQVDTMGLLQEVITAGDTHHSTKVDTVMDNTRVDTMDLLQEMITVGDTETNSHKVVTMVNHTMAEMEKDKMATTDSHSRLLHLLHKMLQDKPTHLET